MTLKITFHTRRQKKRTLPLGFGDELIPALEELDSVGRKRNEIDDVSRRSVQLNADPRSGATFISELHESHDDVGSNFESDDVQNGCR